MQVIPHHKNISVICFPFYKAACSHFLWPRHVTTTFHVGNPAVGHFEIGFGGIKSNVRWAHKDSVSEKYIHGGGAGQVLKTRYHEERLV